jgi:hypothetical protein
MSTQTLYDYLASLTDAASTASGDDFIILKAGVIQKLDQNKILSSLDITALTDATELSGADTFLLQQGGTNKEISASLVMPTGAIVPYGGINTPAGWLFCDGTAYSRTTYAPLYNAVTVSKGEFTVSSASPGVFTLNSHGLATGDCVELTTTGALYTGLSVNTNYYVVYNNANSFWLSTSLANALAGTKINTSGSQSGTHSLRYCPWGISTSSNFLVPDAREASFYGQTAHDAKVFGEFADDQFQGVAYGVPYFNSTAPTSGGSANSLSGTNAGQVLTTTIGTLGAYGTPRYGTVTRGKILGIKYIIKV